MRQSQPRLGILTALALAALAFGAIIAFTGGGTVHILGIRLSATQPQRALIVFALLLVAALRVRGRAAVFAEWRALGRWFRPMPIAITLAVLTMVAGLAWGSRIAGGSDSYGYMSEADLWLHGRLTIDQPFASQVPWPNGPDTFTPLGYHRVAGTNAIASFYSPGFPLLIAAAQGVGGHCAAFLVVPLCGGLLAIVTFGIGRRLGSDWIGLLAVWLLITSPTFLVMLLNTMSDLPAAAFWCLAVYGLLSETSTALLLGGLAAGVGILIRPNLAPLAFVMAGWLIASKRENLMAAFRATLAFCVGPVAASLAIAVINHTLWGSPFRSGYTDIVSWSAANIPANLRNWFVWIATTQTPVLLLGVAVLYVPSRTLWPTAAGRRIAALLGLMLAVVVIAYAAYTPFNAWWFLRFLLPAWPAMCIATAVLIWRVGSRAQFGREIVVAGALVLGIFTAGVASDRGVLTSWEVDQRYPAIASLVDQFTETNSVIFSMQHGGSLRYYGARLTIRYDQLEPDWLDRSVAWLADRDIRAYALLDDEERGYFRERFGTTSALGRLEAPPVFSYQRAVTSYLYDLSNRQHDTQKFGPDAVIVPYCARPGRPPHITFDNRR